MKWTTHSIWGATLVNIILLVLQKGIMPFVILLGALGALFPDIDHPNSKASNANPITKVISIFSIIFIYIFNFVFNAFSSLINMVSPWKVKQLTSVHRSPITHSLMTVVLFGAFTFFFTFAVPLWWWLGLVLGVLSHVLIDSINPSGTPLLWPLNQGRTRFLPEMIAPTTGTLGEAIVSLIVVFLLCGTLLINFQLFGLNTSDIEEVFKTDFEQLFAEKEKPSLFNWNSFDLSTLPPGSIKLPNGEIVLPDGKMLSSLTLDEFDKLGISPQELEQYGLTEQEKEQIDNSMDEFLEKSGINDLIKLIKDNNELKIPEETADPADYQ